MNPDTVRVLLADDHPVYRAGIRAILSGLAGAELVGEASTGTQAIAAAADLQPDVILMDIQMPEVDGIDATHQISAASPHVAIVMLTMFDNDDSVFAALRAGARGYLLKGADHDEISRAVIGVGHGEAIFGPPIATRVLRYFARPQTSAPALFPHLTERERQILELMANGETNPLIARQLFLSPKTVRNHVSNIFSKLHAADRTEAILQARQAGLGSTSDRK